MEITVESLKQAYPDILSVIEKAAYDKGHAEGLAQGTESGVKTGAENERLRIQAVEAVALPGHEALLSGLKYDGITTGEQAAMKILAAEQELRKTKLDAYNSGSPPVVAPVDPAGPETPPPVKKSWPDMVNDYRQTNKCTRSAAVRAIDEQYPDARTEYLKTINSGKEVSHAV